MLSLPNEVKELDADNAKNAGTKLSSLIAEDMMAGELLALDYSEATILVHDALRQKIGGLPMGCLLFATRMTPNAEVNATVEDSVLILLRVIGRAPLPNDSETALHRLDAGFRATDTPENWDDATKADQFTLNRLRHAGVRCGVLGTFRMVESGGRWRLNFGADISNFYSGQGMKVYKPRGVSLRRIVNFTKAQGGSHPLAGYPVEIGRLRYSSSETAIDPDGDNVTVGMEPTDLLARRTALFGMSRTGKSNTIKTIATAIFKLRTRARENGRVGQLIFDVNGEYCNDNPQDSGCLRNVWSDTGNADKNDVVTYGLFVHPNDEGRRLIKINFFGEAFHDWGDRDTVTSALSMLYAGKDVINDHLRDGASLYVKRFTGTSLEPPRDEWDKSTQTRYRRNITVYRSILAKANFAPHADLSQVNIKGLFGEDLREAMASTNVNEYRTAALIFDKGTVSWSELHSALLSLQEFITGGRQGGGHEKFRAFNQLYRENKGKPWNDDMLNGLLSMLEWAGGVSRIRELQDRHSPAVGSDYSTEIIDELVNGKLVIVDQSVGSPLEIKHSAERIMWALFNCQKGVFISPPQDKNGQLIRDENGNIKSPPDIIVYVEEAHNLLPAQNADLESVWPRIAKEGSKFRIGLVFSTQEPSSILSNILKNTDNWFVAHLNNQDETRELKKYYDFEMFVGQILKVPDTGFLRMRCLSNPYIVPVQVNKFEVSPTNKNVDQLDTKTE